MANFRCPKTALACRQLQQDCKDAPEGRSTAALQLGTQSKSKCSCKLAPVISMTKSSASNPSLAPLTKLALALPETQRRIHDSHAQFLVGKKTFAYFLDNHHGDGIVAVTCKVLFGDNKALAVSQPGRFYLPAYIAS